jgi:hypothetical protein
VSVLDQTAVHNRRMPELKSVALQQAIREALVLLSVMLPLLLVVAVSETIRMAASTIQFNFFY